MATIFEAVAAVEAAEQALAARAARNAKAKAAFRSSLGWRRIRYSVLREAALRQPDGIPRCELCNRTAEESGGPLHVDHRIPLAMAEGWRRRYDKANLAVLCCDCNLGKLAGPDWREPTAA